MPNKITYTAVASNTTKSIEYWNPYTQQYQDANPLTGIPAGSYTGLKARLKGSNPAIIATYAGSVIVTDSGTTPTPSALTVSFTIASATAIAGSSLSYSAAANNGTAPYQHLVQAENVATGAPIQIGSASTANYAGIWQNVPAGTYDLTDTVTDATGAVKVSTARRVVVSAAAATKLDPPTNLHQTGSTTTSITLAWDAVANATGYRVQVNGGTTYMPGTALSYTITGLTPGSTPNVQVQALYNGTGNYTGSDYSGAVQATVAAAGSWQETFVLVGGNSLQNDVGLRGDATATSIDVGNSEPSRLQVMVEMGTNHPISYQVTAKYGQTWADLDANFNAQFRDPILNAQAAGKRTYVLLSEWVNSILNAGQSATQAVASAKALVRRIASLSTPATPVVIILLTPTDCEVGSTTATVWEQPADEVRALVLANADNDPYRTLDVRTDPSIGVAGVAATGLGHRIDGGQHYHLNGYGNEVLASLEAGAVLQAMGLALPNDVSSLTVNMSGSTATLAPNPAAGRWIREYQADGGTWKRSPSASGTSYTGLTAGDHNFAVRMAQKPGNTAVGTGNVASTGGGTALTIKSETDAISSSQPGTIVLGFIGSDKASQYDWAYAKDFAPISDWVALTSATFTVPLKDIPVKGLIFHKRGASITDLTQTVYNETAFHDPNAQIVVKLISASATQLQVQVRNSSLNRTHLYLDGNYTSGYLIDAVGDPSTLITLTWNLSPALAAGTAHNLYAYDDNQLYYPPITPFSV
jgi:hypothetical protein